MSQTHDLVVIGAGPAGAAAALEAARAGARALLVDRDASPGGACVRQGTIPSKTLRETAVALAGISARTGGVLGGAVPESATVASLVTRVEQVVAGHERVIAAELDAAGVERWHGR
ncbi:MAG: FAD-dependent oxidoreductase, partial [Deltaproteobacteria bacterium]|nr:FAD-dependent oxidoreductase [Deltaproteobacteria bacterium]